MPFWLSRRPRFRPVEPWQRDQYVVVFTVALAHVGFDLTQPFMPLYVRELGVSDLAEAAFWSGLVVGVAPLCAAIMGPFWGSLADRYGRKPMVLRALVIISVMQFAIAFVPDVYWLLAARVVMGLFAGFTSMAMALAVSIGPRERMAQAIGLVQAAQLAPMAIGPTIGGVISDAFGLRANFLLTGLLLIVPAALLYFLVQESSDAGAAERPGAGTRPAVTRGSAFGLLAIPGFVGALVILFVARFADRSLPPILPLYLVELGTPSAQLATITGLVVASGAVAAACSSMLYGRWARPDNTRRLLIIALIGGAVFSVPLVLAGGWPEVVVLRVVLGLLAGGSMSLAYTMGARLAPPERSGVTLSMLGSCGMLGGAVSPMLAGLIGQVSLRSVFLATAAAYLVAAALAALPLMGRAPASGLDRAAESKP
ncbi:MAG: MFS transporter [Chloroflexi bacterium]|nr:MFS transporter [Chloroflexota bacterium]